MNTKPPQGFELMVNITWTRVGISRYMLLSASGFLWILIFVLLTNEGVENRGTEGEICCSANLLHLKSQSQSRNPARGATSPPSDVQCYCRRADDVTPVMNYEMCHTQSNLLLSSPSFKSLLCNCSTEAKREDARLMDFRTVGGSNIWKWNSTGLSSNWRKKEFDRL